VGQLKWLTGYLYQRLAYRHAGTRAFRQTFIAKSGLELERVIKK